MRAAYGSFQVDDYGNYDDDDDHDDDGGVQLELRILHSTMQ